MAQGETILQIIKEASKPPESETVDVVYGTVATVSPISIRVDSKLTIPADSIELSCLCKPFSTTVLIHTHEVPAHNTQSAGDPSHTHNVNALTTGPAQATIQLWRGLIVGDTVRMIRLSRGNKYYVIERSEALP